MYYFGKLVKIAAMYRTIIIALLILSTRCFEAVAQTNNYFAVQVKTDKGIVEGNYDIISGMQFYLGIPFAKPPVNALRWKAPQPMVSWNGVRQAKKFGPRAVQARVFADMQSRSEGLSEDCLYLNIWTPANRTKKNLPVLVYFYGGGFVAGDGSEPRYDGESMAKKGIVVVTVNYRLNIFGFFAHSELSKEASYKSSGNYGLLDQQAALKWVQHNIAAFGGNPKRVTIAGESAGSTSVSFHMASPLSKDLIAGAIGESGAGIRPLAPVSLKIAETIGLEFARKAGYPTLAELRKLSTKELFEVYTESKRFGFPIVIDGYFLETSLPEVFEKKKQAMVPLLLGWNSAEITGQGVMQGLPYTEENYIKKVKQIYPSDYEEALRLYPHSNVKEIEISATALASDRFIAYSTWKWFDLHRQNSNQPVYRYLYSKLRPPAVNQSPSNGGSMPELVGAPHACEIEYCMGNLHLVKDFVWTADDYKVSRTMQDYFANFIITGNPNANGLPEWPASRPTDSNPDIMIIDLESKSIKANDDARYIFLDKAFGNRK
jgi:para-nitrobenzyl esterase